MGCNHKVCGGMGQDKMGWKGIWWDRMEQDGIGRDMTEFDKMGSNSMEWIRTERDGMGWNRIVWDQIGYDGLRLGKWEQMGWKGRDGTR